MALGSTHLLTEMSTRNISCGEGGGGGRKKGGPCIGLTTFMCRFYSNTEGPTLLASYGPVQACIGIALPYRCGNVKTGKLRIWIKQFWVFFNDMTNLWNWIKLLTLKQRRRFFPISKNVIYHYAYCVNYITVSVANGSLKTYPSTSVIFMYELRRQGLEIQ
jgi:hypothetical protein